MRVGGCYQYLSCHQLSIRITTIPNTETNEYKPVDYKLTMQMYNIFSNISAGIVTFANMLAIFLFVFAFYRIVKAYYGKGAFLLFEVHPPYHTKTGAQHPT